eukprot:8331928-Ditylum_brightwellii.AAC.1
MSCCFRAFKCSVVSLIGDIANNNTTVGAPDALVTPIVLDIVSTAISTTIPVFIPATIAIPVSTYCTPIMSPLLNQPDPYQSPVLYHFLT